MPYIRKARAGSDSFGNTWPSDGAVVEVAPEHAQALLAIADAGFSEVAPPASDNSPSDPTDEQDAEDAPPDGEQDGETDQAVTEAPKPRRGRTPKAAATIEE